MNIKHSHVIEVALKLCTGIDTTETESIKKQKLHEEINGLCLSRHRRTIFKQKLEQEQLQEQMLAGQSDSLVLVSSVQL